MYDESTPYLEFYQKRQWHMTNLPLTDGPVSKHSLQSCRHICSIITPLENHFEFNIKLDTYVIRLAAERDEVMFDWISILKTKLISMGILLPTENVYSTGPKESETAELYETISFGYSESIPQNQRQLTVESSPSSNELLLPPLEEGPPPYEQIFLQSSSGSQQQNTQRPLSFRESQVAKLRNEMSMASLYLKVRYKCLLRTTE